MEDKKIFIGVDAEATGERIQKFMREKGLSTKEVAERIGISIQSVWKWCKGQTIPSLDNMVILSRILEKSIDDLIVKKENGTVKQKSEDGKKSAWTVTVRNEKKAFDKKAGGERDNVNYFTVCMA